METETERVVLCGEGGACLETWGCGDNGGVGVSDRPQPRASRPVHPFAAQRHRDRRCTGRPCNARLARPY